MRSILILAALVSCALAACATTDPWSRWAASSKAYTAIGESLVSARTPCVASAEHPEYGADHPLCLIGDKAYDAILPVMFTASACLDDAKIALEAGRNDNAGEANLACAEGALQRLTLELITRGESQ